MGILTGLFHSRDRPKNSTVGSSYALYMGDSSAGKYKARYEAELETLDMLMQIRDEQLDKDLLVAFHKSGLSHQAVINFMANKQRSDDGEDDES